jgi:hypothetical protein
MKYVLHYHKPLHFQKFYLGTSRLKPYIYYDETPSPPMPFPLPHLFSANKARYERLISSRLLRNERMPAPEEDGKDYRENKGKERAQAAEDIGCWVGEFWY